MGLLSKLFRRGDDSDDVEVSIHLDLDLRRRQLTRLEQALDALADGMRSDHTLDDPGWRSRVNEYRRLAGEAAAEKRAPTWETLLDLVFQVRPVFAGPVPLGYESIRPLQAEVMAAADDLRELRPGERG